MKGILIFLSDTFYNINIFQGDEAKVVSNTSDWAGHLVNFSADWLFLANSLSHR